MRGAWVVVAMAFGGSCLHQGAWPDPQAPSDPRRWLIVALGDPAALGRMLRGSVVNGGLWFEDPACREAFPAGAVAADRFPEFARCLVGLHARRSERRDSLLDVVVLEYAPGFEIEAQVVAERGGPRLTWIGYEARRDNADALPTITPAALESLRVAGDPNAPVPLSGEASAATWLKVCIDDAGAVTSADLRETTSFPAAQASIAAARDWKFRPFSIGGRAVPVCAMEMLRYPPAKPTEPEVIPLPFPGNDPSGARPVVMSARTMEGKRVGGINMIVPDDPTKTEIQESGVRAVSATLFYCLDNTGHVASVRPMRLTGFASYDRTLTTEIKKWAFKPVVADGQGVFACAAVTFIYSQH